MNRPNTVQDFLNHRTSSERVGFLGDWKEKGSLENFMHTAHVPICVWSHTWPTVVTKEDKDTKQVVNRVWGKRYNCPETEEILRNQYKRDRDTEARRYPPARCGMCKLLDWVFMQIVAGKLPLEKAIFRVSGDIAKEEKVIHAAGFVNRLKKEFLSDGAMERIRKAGISLRDGFQENCMAKAEYLAIIVDNAQPSAGPQIATITASLGDKLKDAIGDEMAKALKAKKDASLGDPFTHPYMFEWIYNEAEEDPGKKYRVRTHIEVHPSQAILEKIRSAPLDLTQSLAPMDQATLRARLERACLLKGSEAPPWDKLFDVEAEERDEDDADVDFPPSDGQQQAAPPAGRAPEVGTKPKTPEELVAGIAEEDLYTCTGSDEIPGCGKGSPDSDKCVWCGLEYDEAGNPKTRAREPEPPAAPKGRQRNAKPKADAAPAEAPKAKQFKPGF